MPGGLGKGALSLVALLGVLGYAFHATEHSPNLRFPAPSFKQIGPKITPWLAPVETNKEPFLHNTFLHRAERLFVGEVLGSESVTYGPDGKLYMLDKFGSVLRAKPEAGEKLDRVAHLGPGRPLGYHFDAQGNLVICNAGTGLQLLDMATRKVTLLASEAPVDEASSKTSPIHYANDLAIASDGSVLFTDSTDVPPAINAAGFYDTLQSFVLAFLQGERTGRLLRYDPGTGRTSLLAHSFWYPNGVTLAQDESFALVVETCTLKVHRIWLKGPRAGERETFFEDPPGFPDGITAASDGTFWLAVISPRQPALELALGSRFFRWLIPRMPAPKKVQNGTAIIQLSAEGRVLRYLADPQGSHIATIAAISEAPGGFFLGNLGGDFVSFLSSDSLPPPLNSSAAMQRRLHTDKRVAADANLSSRERYASEATISVAAIRGTTMPL